MRIEKTVSMLLADAMDESMNVSDAWRRVEFELSMTHPEERLHGGKILFVHVLVPAELASVMLSGFNRRLKL